MARLGVVIKVLQKRVVKENFQVARDSPLVIVKQTVKLGEALTALQTAPVLDCSLVLVLAGVSFFGGEVSMSVRVVECSEKLWLHRHFAYIQR